MTLTANSEDLLSIGARLKEFRETYIGTQAELANEAGITIRTITRFETGKTIPSSSFLKHLAKHHKTNTEYILTGKGNPIMSESFKKEAQTNSLTRISRLETEVSQLKKMILALTKKLEDQVKK